MKPKRNPDVMWRVEKGFYDIAMERASKGEDYEDMGVLTLSSGSSIHQLNLIGAEIWKRINGIFDSDRIVEEIAETFDVEPGEMKKDVEDFLVSLEKRGWITIE